MGSSSKSRKEKDSRRKSRSRSKERESRHESRKRTRRHWDGDSSDDSDTSPAKVSRRDAIKKEPESEPAASGSRQEELSTEETNKLRISLGLKPLEVDGPGDATLNEDGTVPPMKTEEVFVKTENISDKLEAEKIRERFQTQKEKRQLQEKLKSIKPLGHESTDEEDDDPMSWVLKSRELEKKRAEEKERQLQELDEEIEQQNQEKEMIRKQNLYKERDLKGLTVGHSLDTIKEGTQIVLTLRDKELLDDGQDDDGDVLENVNIIDEEKAKENVLNMKRGKNDYNPYDDDEDKNLLSKYDETIDGKKKESFKLGHNLAEEAFMKLKAAQEEAKLSGKILVNLDDLPSTSSSLKFATEYYTEEEMKKFRKPKKVRNKKNSMKKRLDDDDIVPVASSASSSDVDLASRSKRRRIDGDEDAEMEEDISKKVLESKKSLPRITLMDIDEDEDNDNKVDVSQVVLEDDGAEEELQAALEKARRLREQKKTVKSSVQEQIASMIAVKRETSMDMDEPSTSTIPGQLGMNSLAEFCRNIGESSNVKVEYDSDMNDSDEEEEIVIKKRERSDLKPLVRSSDQVKVDTKAERKGKWTEVNDMEIDAEDDDDDNGAKSRTKSKETSVKVTPILGEEPALTMGVASALKLAMNKGYLESGDGKKSGAVPKNSKLSAVNYLIDEKFGGADDRRSNRDRYSGRVQEFQEKSGYKPQVNLEYIDDDGRILNEKEAFRQLSHKFHGKGPSKNKIDKRMQKLKQESKLRQMSSVDTPLNTVKKLQEKQKELQSPYVVISGHEAALIKKK